MLGPCVSEVKQQALSNLGAAIRGLPLDPVYKNLLNAHQEEKEMETLRREFANLRKRETDRGHTVKCTANTELDAECARFECQPKQPFASCVVQSVMRGARSERKNRMFADATWRWPFWPLWYGIEEKRKKHNEDVKRGEPKDERWLTPICPANPQRAHANIEREPPSSRKPPQSKAKGYVRHRRYAVSGVSH
jgi:hypothetical protein